MPIIINLVNIRMYESNVLGRSLEFCTEVLETKESTTIISKDSIFLKLKN